MADRQIPENKSATERFPRGLKLRAAPRVVGASMLKDRMFNECDLGHATGRETGKLPLRKGQPARPDKIKGARKECSVSSSEGTIADGTENPRRTGDIGIRNGLVAEIGTIAPQNGVREIGARGWLSLRG